MSFMNNIKNLSVSHVGGNNSVGIVELSAGCTSSIAVSLRADSSGSVNQTTHDDLTVSMFAARASVTPQAVRKMIAEGRLRARKVGEQYVINNDELARYLR